MKKSIIILICFTLISCLKEPKKVDNSTNQPIKPQIKDTIKTSIPKELEKDTVEIISKNEDNIIKDNDLLSNYNMSINTLEFLVKGSPDDFENWAVRNDYKFSEIKEYNYFNSIVYKKPLNFITFGIEKDNKPMCSMTYETNSKDEYLFLKESCFKQGYTNIKSKTFGKETGDTERIFNEYSNGKLKITFILSNKGDNLGYTIAIEKLSNNK